MGSAVLCQSLSCKELKLNTLCEGEGSGEQLVNPKVTLQGILCLFRLFIKVNKVILVSRILVLSVPGSPFRHYPDGSLGLQLFPLFT